MAVLVRTARILRIVKVNRPQAVKTNCPVKLFENIVQIVHNIIASIPNMAGV